MPPPILLRMICEAKEATLKCQFFFDSARPFSVTIKRRFDFAVFGDFARPFSVTIKSRFAFSVSFYCFARPFSITNKSHFEISVLFKKPHGRFQYLPAKPRQYFFSIHFRFFVVFIEHRSAARSRHHNPWAARSK